MASSSPLVSIIIPTYNHAKYLVEAIESVLNQKYQNIELIVLDDGSTDNTVELLKKYNKIFFWESHKNRGQANTLNKGWHLAKGSIIAYLSADDVLKPTAVSESIKCLETNSEAILCYPNFDLIDSESRIVRTVTAPEYSYEEMLTKFICAPGPGAFFRRSGFNKIGGWDINFKHSPDYEYWLRLGLLGKFIHIKKNLAMFRIHEESQSFSKTTCHRAEEPLRIINKFYKQNNLPQFIYKYQKISLANANLITAQLHLRSGRYKEAFYRIKKASKISINSLLSIRFFRLIFNGLFNQFIHRFIFKVKNFFALSFRK